jgi:lipopolysaccharide biosynthesis regulator YciM
MNYKDPLFSVLVFLLLVGIGFLISMFISRFKESSKLKHIQNFVKKFDFLDNEEIKSLFLSKEIPLNALLLLAIAFEKEGNYEKSLNIYLAIIDTISGDEKYQVLQNMANSYLKAGFLHKARESLLEVLRAKPRTKEALLLLLVVDDKLKNYSEMENVIEILDEIGEEISDEKANLEFQKALFEQDEDKMDLLYREYPVLKRAYFQYFIHKNPSKVYKLIQEKDVYEMIDLFWREDYLPLKNDAFIQIEAAKKHIKAQKQSPFFEIEVLKRLPDGLADLEFEYVCSKCKHIFPVYEARCPKCKNLFTFKTKTGIVKGLVF